MGQLLDSGKGERVPRTIAALPFFTRVTASPQQRVQILDRSNAYGDRDFDRGVFRHITFDMDPEYELDMVSIPFSLAEDYQWFLQPNGFRTRMGSVSKARFIYQSMVRNRVALGEAHAILIDGVMQQDFRADRAWLEDYFLQRVKAAKSRDTGGL